MTEGITVEQALRTNIIALEADRNKAEVQARRLHRHINLERGALIEMLTKERDKAIARAEKAEQALLIIGERAVVDFDDRTVGEINGIGRVIKDPEHYSDWVRTVMDRAQRCQQAEAERDSALAAAAEMRGQVARLRDAIRDLVDHADNVLEDYGHESPVMREHPRPCVGLDFCAIKDYRRRLANAERALAATEAEK